MEAIVRHGTPLVEDPERVGYGHGRPRRRQGDRHGAGCPAINSAAELRQWFSAQDPLWLETIEVVATDLAESYRRAMSSGAANRVVDKVRRRVQNETLGHRGREGDPLYRIRKLLLTGSERLDEPGHERMLLGLRRGDPHDELLGAWLAKESVRDIYLTECPWPVSSPQFWPPEVRTPRGDS